MLKREKAKSTAAKRTYAEIEHRKGSTLSKNELLITAMFDSDSDAWEEQIVTIKRGLSHTKTKGKDGEWMYAGQLEVLLGRKTAMQHIRKRKYEEQTDAQGDKQYRFVRSVDSEKVGLATTVDATRSGTKSSKELSDLAGQMMTFFNGSTASSSMSTFEMPALADTDAANEGNGTNPLAQPRQPTKEDLEALKKRPAAACEPHVSKKPAACVEDNEDEESEEGNEDPADEEEEEEDLENTAKSLIGKAQPLSRKCVHSKPR